jgi:UDP-N-acetylmuramyl pentapeptide phosphotransferase/UDP-N-acetylglucosamine-1-phosphate transferase
MRMMLGIVALSVLIATAGATAWIRRLLLAKQVLDIPNARSSHSAPTPRGGGLAVIFCFMAGALALKMLQPATPFPGPLFFAGLALVTLAGFMDDRFSLPVALRFAVQAAAAYLVVYETGGLSAFPLPEPLSFPLGVAALPLTLFWMLAVMNIYNFLDGIDGYATMQALVAGGGMMLLDPHGPGFYMGALIAAASFAFFYFNWHPASLFLGDSGSISLGYIFACMPFYLRGHGPEISVYFMICLLWFFLSDGSFIIVSRLLKREKIWVAHRSHLYQRLTIAGLAHDQVVIRILLLQLVNLALIACLYLYAGRLFYLSLAQLVLFFLIYWGYVVWRERAGSETQ